MADSRVLSTKERETRQLQPLEPTSKMANGVGTSTKRSRDGSAVPAKGAGGKKGTRSRGAGIPNNNNDDENDEGQDEMHPAIRQPEDNESDDDLASARPVKRVVKPDGATKKQPTASTSTGKSRSKGTGKDVPAESEDNASPAMSMAIRNLESENAKLRAQMQSMKDGHSKLQDLMSELQNIRHTEVEAQLEEVVAQSNLRAETSRKQVNTYASETEELRGEVLRLKDEVAKLRALPAGDKRQSGSNGGEQEAGDPEEMEGDATTVIPETQFSDSKSDRRHRELAEAAEEAHRAQVEELEQADRDAQNRIRELERALKVQRREQEEARGKAVQELTLQHRQEMASAEAQTAEAQAKAGQLEKELAFEIQQSKELQTKAANNIRAPVASQMLSSSTGLSSAEDVAKIAGLEAVTKLLLDLAGFSLVSTKQGERPTSRIYDFLMSDFRKKKTLHFKLMVSPTIEPGMMQYDFIPEFMKGRDDDVRSCLDDSLRGHIQFKEPQLHYFFRRLYRSMNEQEVVYVKEEADQGVQ